MEAGLNRIGMVLLGSVLLLGSGCRSTTTNEIAAADIGRFPGILAIAELSLSPAPEVTLVDAIARIRAHVPDAHLLDARLGRIQGELNCYARLWSEDGPRIVDMKVPQGEVHFDLSRVRMSPPPRGQEALLQLLTGLIDPTIAVSTAISTKADSWARAIEVRQGPEEPVYVVELVSGSELREIRVLARSGRLLDSTPLK